MPVQVDVAASAMVWREPGRAHEMLAVPAVVLEPGDVLVEIELATICGSDVHTTQGQRSAPAPLVLGHEQVGRVVAVGDAASTSNGSAVVVGDRVVWSLTVSCGSCVRCRRGLPQKCTTVRKYGHERVEDGWELSGGFATHMHVRAGTTIVPVAENLPAAVLAPVSCGTATAVAALDAAEQVLPVDAGWVDAGPDAGSMHAESMNAPSVGSPLHDAVVLIFGAGLIGLTLSALAADRGAKVIVVDPDRARRELATRFGATATADPTEEPGAADSLAPVLGLVGEAPLVAIDASGSPRAVASAIDSLGVGGVAVLVGSVFPTAPVTLDPESIVRRLVTVRGVHNYAPRHLDQAVRFVEERFAAYPFAELVGATVALDDLDEGIAAAAEARAVRIGVDPGRIRR